MKRTLQRFPILKNFVIALFLLAGSWLQAQQVILAVRPHFEPNSDRLYAFDPVTFAETCSIPLTISGGPVIDGMNGVAVHPATGEIFVIAKLNVFPGSQRRLLNVDPATGIATIVGNLGDAFAAIVFASDGTLYGVTGDGASTPETLFTINPATAATTFHTTLGNGNDGECIAFNSTDGLLYHASGLGTQNVSEIFETITIPGSPGTITNVLQSGDDYTELFGLGYVGGGTFIGFDLNSKVFSITSAGVVTDLGVTLAADHRGLVLCADPDMDGCPDIVAVATIPTMGEWGLIILALLVLSFGTVFLMRSRMAVAGAGNVSFSSSIPFDRSSFARTLVVVMPGLAASFAVAIFGFGYEMTSADVPGSIMSATVLAYLIHLFLSAKREA